MEDETVAGDEDESQPVAAGMRYEHGKVVPHLTVAERVARGKAARREVPRASHAGFTPGAEPAGPGGAAGTAGREPGCRSWCRSATAACWCRRSPSIGVRRCIMAADLAGTPRSGITTQVLW